MTRHHDSTTDSVSFGGFMKLVLAFLVLVVAATSFADSNSSIACWSKDFGKRPVVIKMSKATATFSFAGKSCILKSIPYKPQSPKYEGWVRFGNQNPSNHATRKTACTDIMAAFFNQNNPTAHDFPDVHWISVSTEVQNSGNGMLQLGWQNLWDPGAGGTAKTMLGCRPNQQQ